MFCRWDCRVYDVGLLLGVLGPIIDSLDLTSMLGGRTKRPPEPYLEDPVLKEMFKVSLRYAENMMILGFKVYLELLGGEP